MKHWLHNKCVEVFVAVLMIVGLIAFIGTVGVMVGAVAGAFLLISGLIGYWTRPKETSSEEKSE